jgi:4'-phosphopantetheinyl transferase
VQVWQLPLDGVSVHESALMALLTAEECQRAWRFHFARDRQTFVGTRAVLRILLGAYLDQDPAAIQFHYGAWGKPMLVPEENAGGAEFNVSHSHGIALLAFHREQAVGVDVEMIRADLDLDEMAVRFFSTREVTRLRMLPAEERTAAFFRCWTRKEAFLKAYGTGLALPLSRFSVSLEVERADLVEAVDRPEEVARWKLVPLTVGPEYAAALAVACEKAPRVAMQSWNWEQ